MITEYTKHENKEKNWVLHEIRTFNNKDGMDDALLLVNDLETQEFVLNDELQDDVWQFDWTAVESSKHENVTIPELLELLNLKQ